jgi:hypothetical protein
MADTVAKLGRERSLSTLAKRLFVIEGPDAERKLKHAEAALLHANPDLATADGFAVGRTVIVPGTIGLAATDRVAQPKEGAAGLFDEMELRLQGAGAALATRIAEAERAVESALERVSDRRFAQKLRRALPDSTGLLAETRETLKQRREAEKARAATFANAIEDARTELAKLRALAESRR